MIKYDPDKHHRRSIRLKGYDYSQPGAYFVTICANQRQCLFGEIVDEQMCLNRYGRIVADEWRKSSLIRQEIELDQWVVMSNHFHAIVIITNDPVGANDRSPLRNGSLIQHYSLSSNDAHLFCLLTKLIQSRNDVIYDK